MRDKQHPISVCPYCGYDSDTCQMKPHHLAPLETILDGRYLLGRVLGEGGFGITYAALDLQTGQRVAIKELFIAGLFSRENTCTVLVDNSIGSRTFYSECKNRFIQEAELMRRLRDKKGVVDIYSYFEENKTAYIVMEYLDGDDLFTYLKNRGGRISFDETFILLRPVMKSLILMHDLGVFHTDIAPDNIRYLSTGRMKIMDLGGAKYSCVPDRNTVVLVKHGYTPPEQYTSGYKIGPWMDVYAMSATIYRCITGKAPKKSILRETDEDIEKPSELAPGIPKEAEQVILKGLALKTEDRYVDMRDLYTALKKVCVDLGVITESVTPRDGAGSEKRQPENYEELLEELNSSAQKKRVLPIASICAAAAAVIAGIALFGFRIAG
ncbi:MAG: serine/threonine protein kinase [Clostridiales bacterium]|nr:serine/threonine protein kinase [Clostridiales bacterium]